MKSPYRSPTTLIHTQAHVDEVKALSRPTLHLFTNIDYFYNESHSRRKRGAGRREAEGDRSHRYRCRCPRGHKWFTSRVEKTHTSILVRFRFEVALFLPHPPPIIVSTCSSDANALWHMDLCGLQKKQHRKQKQYQQQSEIIETKLKPVRKSQISFI